ncbi:MAG: tetratricopeptide repeat protein [Myxococcales bacterium]
MLTKPRERPGWGEQLARIPLLLVLVVSTGLGERGAHADDASDARQQYQNATAHFAIGEYREAAAAYEAAFKLKQDPALLYNAAQSHRLAGDDSKALLLYRNLVRIYPSSSYAADSLDHIHKLERAGATVGTGAGTEMPGQTPGAGAALPSNERSQADAGAGGVEVPFRPSGPPAPTPREARSTFAAGAQPLVGSPPAVSPSMPAEEKIYKRRWFWAATGGVVVAVIAVVVAAVSLSGGKSWSTNPDLHGAP